jgi:hypothetical protein
MEIKVTDKIYLKISEGEYNFSDVIDGLENSFDVFITTFNLSLERKTELINKFQELNANVTVISNIPENYYKNSSNEEIKKKAVKQIELYTNAFNETYNVTHIINLALHGKMVITDKIGYIGSANYSDYSKNSIEFGIVIKDKNVLSDIKNKVIPFLISHEKSITKAKFGKYWIQYHEEKLNKIKQLEKSIRELYDTEILSFDNEYSVENKNKFYLELDLLYKLLMEMNEDLHFFSEEHSYVHIPATPYEMEGYNPEYDCKCMLENGILIFEKYPENYSQWLNQNCNEVLKYINMIIEGLKISIETISEIYNKTEDLKK